MLGSRDDGHALALARGLRGSEIATWQHAGQVLPRCCLPSGSGWMGDDSQSFDRDIQNAVKSISIRTPRVRTSWRRTEETKTCYWCWMLLPVKVVSRTESGVQTKTTTSNGMVWVSPTGALFATFCMHGGMPCTCIHIEKYIVFWPN